MTQSFFEGQRAVWRKSKSHLARLTLIEHDDRPFLKSLNSHTNRYRLANAHLYKLSGPVRLAQEALACNGVGILEALHELRCGGTCHGEGHSFAVG